MAEETTQVTSDSADTPEVPAGSTAPEESTVAQEVAPANEVDSPIEPEQEAVPLGQIQAPIAAESAETSSVATEVTAPQEPDALKPYLDKAKETIQHEVDDEELDQFLRAHIKTFREEWDVLSDSAKDAYVHMMTSQLLQRKAATTRIMNYEEFKLPVPSAQTKLFESIKQSQVKPLKRRPVLLMPPNLRPTYSLKK